MCQGSGDEWVEAHTQTQATKAWQVPDASKPSESNRSPAQNIEVTSLPGLKYTECFIFIKDVSSKNSEVPFPQWR